MKRFTLASAIALFALASSSSSQGVMSKSEILAQTRVSHGDIQALAVPEVSRESFQLRVALDGRQETLSLYPHSLRAPNYQLLVQGEDGVLRPGPETVETTYRGSVLGYPESVVSASVRGGQIHATLVLAEGEPEMGIQPVSRLDAAAPRNQHVVYSARDSIQGSETCGVDTTFAQHPEGLDLDPQAVTFDLKLCQIACDADVEFYNWSGGTVEETEAEIESVLNGVDNIYAGEVEIIYEITTIIVRTSEPDPYGSTGANSLLNQFESQWLSNHQGIQRDIAHLFTGKEINGTTIGIANFNGICSTFNGFGLSQSSYSPNLANRRALTAHELGHNWNASHCDGQSDCAIMCSGLGGCIGNIKTFGAFPSAQILNKKNSANCLSVPSFAAPNPQTQTPSVVSAFQGGTVEITGTDLRFITQIEVDGELLDELKWTALTDTKFELNNVLYKSTGSVPVAVSTLGGTTVFNLEVSQPSGFGMLGHSLLPPDADYVLEWLGGPDDIYLLTYGFAFGTFDLLGFPILTPSTVVLIDQLSSAGTAGLQVPNPGLPPFTRLYFQAVTFDENTIVFNGATTIFTTLFL